MDDTSSWSTAWQTDSDTEDDVLREATNEDGYQGPRPDDLDNVDWELEGLDDLDPFHPALFEIPAPRPGGPCIICSTLLEGVKHFRKSADYNGVDQIFAAAIVRRHVFRHKANVPILPELIAYHTPNGTEVKRTLARSLSVYDELRYRHARKEIRANITSLTSHTEAGNPVGAPGAGPPAPSVSDGDLPPMPIKGDSVVPDSILRMIAQLRLDKYLMLLRRYRLDKQRARDFEHKKHFVDKCYNPLPGLPGLLAWKMKERLMQWMEQVDPVCVDCAGECTCERLE